MGLLARGGFVAKQSPVSGLRSWRGGPISAVRSYHEEQSHRVPRDARPHNRQPTGKDSRRLHRPLGQADLSSGVIALPSDFTSQAGPLKSRPTTTMPSSSGDDQAENDSG
jgi:hypothetical protein